MADRYLGLTLPVKLGANGYFGATSDVLEQVRSNLTNLLLTQKGERVMQPNFGCDIYKVVFQPMTDDGLSEVRASIETAVQTWMPFVQVNDVRVQRNEATNGIVVSIAFTLVTNDKLGDSLTLVF